MTMRELVLQLIKKYHPEPIPYSALYDSVPQMASKANKSRILGPLKSRGVINTVYFNGEYHIVTDTVPGHAKGTMASQTLAFLLTVYPNAVSYAELYEALPFLKTEANRQRIFTQLEQRKQIERFRRDNVYYVVAL